MSTKALTTIAVEMAEIVRQIQEQGGELSEVLERAFDISGQELAEKADRYAGFLDRLEMEADYHKQKAAEFSKVAKACTNLQERLKANIKVAMQAMDSTEIQGTDMRFVLSRSNPKLTIDDTKLPASWKMPVTEMVPDKDRIKAALEVGEQIEGVTQEATYSLRKYTGRKVK